MTTWLDEALLQAELLEVMPSVEEVNSISEALEKKKRFDLVIVSPEARGELSGRTEVSQSVISNRKIKFILVKEMIEM